MSLTASELIAVEGVLAGDKFATDKELIQTLCVNGLDESEAVRLVMTERPRFASNPLHVIDWTDYTL